MNWLSFSKTDTLTLMLINTHSLSANLPLISQYITDYKFSIDAITEIWLNIQYTVTTASLEALGYKLCCKSRNEANETGVLLLIKYNVNIISETSFPWTICNILLTKLQFNNNIIHNYLFTDS